MSSRMSSRRVASVSGGAPEAANAPSVPPERQPYLPALAAALAVFALYSLTLAPTTAFWDASEYIAVAHILGIPHPPGNPLFVLLASSWTELLSPLGLSTAVRVNLFSAAMSAGAIFFWYLVVVRILGAFTSLRWARLVGAGAAVAASATAFTVWNQSNVNEKVYTISLFTIAFLAWAGFRWRDYTEAHAGRAQGRWRDDNVILLMVFLLALSIGNHLMGVLVAPALVLLLFLVKPRVFLDWRLYVAGLAMVVLGLSVQFYLPIRAGLDPVINEAAPACESLRSAAVSIYTLGERGCEALSASLRRDQYAKPPLTVRMAPFWAQMAMYLQYFDWQWSRSLGGTESYFAAARLPFTLLFGGLGVLGAWRHFRQDRTSFAFMATLFFTLSVALVFYMNFKYGYRQSQVLQTNSYEVRERDYFYIVSFSVWGLWVGIGLTWIWLRLAERLRQLPRPHLVAAPVLAIALIPLVLNWSYATRAGDYAARDFAYNMLQSVEPYGVLFTTGDNDTFPLWYLQEVEGIRQDVTVVVGSYINTDWYAKQVRDLTTPCATPDAWTEHPTRIICQRPFRSTLAPPLYGSPPTPTSAILPLSDDQIAAVSRSVSVLPQDMVFEARGIQALVPAGTYIEPKEQFTLAIILHSWGERAIHFSGLGTPQTLGLSPYLARHGITYKLVTPEEGAELVAVPRDRPWLGAAYVDVERTNFLLWQGFRYDDDLQREVWADQSTRNLPMFYAYAHAELATGYEVLGDTVAAQRNLMRLEDWVDLANR
jgi:hypothetical protein